jgi:hypothetical protein
MVIIIIANNAHLVPLPILRMIYWTDQIDAVSVMSNINALFNKDLCVNLYFKSLIEKMTRTDLYALREKSNNESAVRAFHFLQISLKIKEVSYTDPMKTIINRAILRY